MKIKQILISLIIAHAVLFTHLTTNFKHKYEIISCKYHLPILYRKMVFDCVLCLIVWCLKCLISVFKCIILIAVKQ